MCTRQQIYTVFIRIFAIFLIAFLLFFPFSRWILLYRSVFSLFNPTFLLISASLRQIPAVTWSPRQQNGWKTSLKRCMQRGIDQIWFSLVSSSIDLLFRPKVKVSLYLPGPAPSGPCGPCASDNK